MDVFVRRLKTEFSHFSAMPAAARLLTLSYQLRSVAYPMLSIFTGAYIFRTENDVTLLILYYMGNFLALPVMFVVNRRLLARISLRRLYLAGTLISGLAPLLVIFHRWDTPAAYLAYGLVYGVGSGLYWANRNFLTVRHTESAFRGYFTGLQFTLGTIASMVVPVIAGWFIVLTPYGYQVLGIGAFVLLAAAGLVMRGGSFEQPDISTGTRPLSRAWRKARYLSLAIGCVDSVIYILPTVLVLYAVGNEATLGMVSGAVSLLSAAASYVMGRKYRYSAYIPVFGASLFGFVIAGVPALWGITVFTVAWYLVAANISDSTVWIANEPVIMDMMDEEAKRSHVTLSRLIIDREWFINMGRLLVLGVFLVLARIRPELGLAAIGSLSGLLGLGFLTIARRVNS